MITIIFRCIRRGKSGKSFVTSHPREWQASRAGGEDQRAGHAVDMNAQADIQKVEFKTIAARFLGAEAPESESRMSGVWHRTKEHLWLVGVSLLFSVLVGIPLGVMAVRFHAAGQAILLSSALIQTVPSRWRCCAFWDSGVWGGDEAGACRTMSVV